MDGQETMTKADLVEPAEVHQASGMLTVQLGVTVTDAIGRMRAHATRTHRPLVDVSIEIIAGRLQLPMSAEPN